jgi:hypothetical protein
MKRFIASSRSRSNISSASAVGDQLIREFTAQAQAVMEELSAQFSDTLQSQAEQILQTQVAAHFGDDSDDADDGGSGSGGDNASTVGQLLNTGVRYLVSRPHTRTRTVETARSVQAAQLSVSSSQAAAEAQTALSKGSKNL